MIMACRELGPLAAAVIDTAACDKLCFAGLSGAANFGQGFGMVAAGSMPGKQGADKGCRGTVHFQCCCQVTPPAGLHLLCPGIHLGQCGRI